MSDSHAFISFILFQLAKYCDLVLKKSTKNLTDVELDEKLSEVVSSNQYITLTLTILYKFAIKL